ncbi:site-specific DNA-methyltransferase [Corynebacterium sp. CCM 9185]|uniref:Site-specific DNA-methyltransferase n=1 Tax=Corynebacterium marambiense TaxID=2765364 RepID=A0ABS0VX63_9CORY|nr:site-specific DNA-methyltransferase [Corynebacterium marambiense]MCK7663294.1 site-specific DNA-methyltransferase [Corynebacterium marambiense]
MTKEHVDVPHASPDFRTDLARKLADLAPEIISDGQLDVAKLSKLLGDDAAVGPERFGLHWPGKRDAQRVAQMPTTATLKPDHDRSKDWDTTSNVFIEGDNLEVLKVLQKHYYGTITMIYIDPPYNTGRDFVYKDDFRDGMSAYLNWTEQTDKSGKLSSNAETAGRYHSNWLNMMYPRLKLARNLLSDNGIFMVSIDDNEQAKLRDLCDEIFGEQNFITSLVHQRAKGGGQAKYVVKGHDLIHVYARSIAHAPPLMRKKVIQGKVVHRDGVAYLRNDDVIRRVFGKYEKGTERRCFYEEIEELKGPDKKIKIDAELASGALELEVDEKTGNHIVVRYEPVSEAKSKMYSIVTALSELGKNDLAELGMEEYFSYPKPTELLKLLVSAAMPADGTVLDFFAGSGTTAHAVLKLNAGDGGRRRCISVQLPEPTPEGSAARDAGFSTIADISRERIRRAGDRIESGETHRGHRNEQLDTGFRAYTLADTNFATWRVTADVSANDLGDLFESARNSAKNDATPEDLFIEILLKLGLSLTENYARTTLAGLEVFSVDRGLVIGYLNKHVKPTLGQLREVVDATEARLIILEDSFHGDDELKTNLVQLCRTRGIDLSIA